MNIRGDKNALAALGYPRLAVHEPVVIRFQTDSMPAGKRGVRADFLAEPMTITYELFPFGFHTRVRAETLHIESVVGRPVEIEPTDDAAAVVIEDAGARIDRFGGPGPFGLRFDLGFGVVFWRVAGEIILMAAEWGRAGRLMSVEEARGTDPVVVDHLRDVVSRDPWLADEMANALDGLGGLGPLVAMGASLRHDVPPGVREAVRQGPPFHIRPRAEVLWVRSLTAAQANDASRCLRTALDCWLIDALAAARAECDAWITHILERRELLEGAVELRDQRVPLRARRQPPEVDEIARDALGDRLPTRPSEILERAAIADPEAWWAQGSTAA